MNTCKNVGVGQYLARDLPARGLSFLWGLMIIACLQLPTAYAQSAPPENQEVIHIGGNADFMPFEYIDAAGEPAGFTVDLVRAVARQMDLNISITLGPWNQMLRQLENRQVDALTGVLYSKARDRSLDFSVPHLVFSYAVFVRNDSRFSSVLELKGKAALVVEDVYAHDWLRANNFTSRIFPVETPEAALKLLSRGEHDFAVLPRLHGLDMISRLGIDNLKTIGPPVLTQKFCFAVAAGNVDLLAQLNEGLLKTYKSGEYDRIYQKWFSVYEQRNRLLRYALWIGLPLLGLVLAALLWNLSLKKTLARKTRQLRENRTMLDQIIQGLPMPTFVVDRHKEVIHWNRACEVLTGVSADQIIGTRKHRDLFYRELRPVMSDMLLDPTHTDPNPDSRSSGVVDPYLSVAEGICRAEFKFSHFDPNGKWLYGTAALARHGSGEIIGAIECWQDMTEYKQLESQLIQSQKMEAIGTLAAGIAHDFGNILMAISANAELAWNSVRRGIAADENLSVILKNAKNGQRLIRRMLDFSRESEVTIQPLRLDKLVAQTMDLIRASLPSSIRIHCHIDCQARVAVDITQFQQVLMNLCTNAAQAMGGRTGELTIRLTDAAEDDVLACRTRLDNRGDRFVKLTLSDTGSGIPANILNRIFDPFFTTKNRGEGTGLGLSVSQGIVERFGGCIAVDSEPGRGADFHVFLPFFRESLEAPGK